MTDEFPLQQQSRRAASAYRSRILTLIIGFGLLATSACAAAASTTDAEVAISTEEFAAANACTGSFEPLDLPHETRGPGRSDGMLDGLGSGVAVGDLDNDGLDDIVLPNLAGETSILWNDGDLRFIREPLIEGRFRQVNIVDIDGDGHRDISLTTGIGRPLTFFGTSTRSASSFSRIEIRELDILSYSLSWGDLGGDGDIDAVGASYNAELTAMRQLNVAHNSGTVVFENTDDGYVTERLADDGQSLVTVLTDLNGDGRTDIYVGNDLATPDRIWHASPTGWEAVEPFEATTYSTMSIDFGDIDNDGDNDLFATDMRPMDDTAETRSAYAEVAADLAAAPRVDDVQSPENVLQLADGEAYDNTADEVGVRATGWSWSGLFGDLDNDGLLDLYVVNGMVAEELFAHLPGNALIEENQAFRNSANNGMTQAPEWGLSDDASGRGMVMTDLDQDGDLDVVINNLNAPARIYENRLCDVGAAVEISLAWDNTLNPDGLGAQVSVSSEDGIVRRREIAATRGYLSGGPARAFVGLGQANGDVEVEIRWPDGKTSTVTQPVGSRSVVTRSTGAS